MVEGSKKRDEPGTSRVLEYYSGSRPPANWRKCTLVLVGYTLATFVAVLFLEPGLTPPGFTGRGFAALVITMAGAFHAGRLYRNRALLFSYGCIGVMAVFPEYLDSRRGLALAYGGQVFAWVVLQWVMGALAAGILAVVFGWAGARSAAGWES